MNQDLSVLILAGGQSSRMGQDKALIPVGGMPLLQRTCQVALQCSSTVLVITSQTQAYRAIAPPTCQFVQEQIPPNELAPQGPLVGFAQGLAQVHTAWVLLLACDLPYLQSSTLQSWFKQRDDTNGAIALLPRAEKGWEPLCGFYHTRCQETLVPFIQQGGRSFQRWLAQETVQAIALSSEPEMLHQEQQMLFNCNTPTDLLGLLL